MRKPRNGTQSSRISFCQIAGCDLWASRQPWTRCQRTCPRPQKTRRLSTTLEPKWLRSCCWLLVVGCWLLAVGCWLLAVGCWLLAVGCWLLAVGCRSSVVGRRSSVVGRRSSVVGRRSSVVGCRLSVVGCWLLVFLKHVKGTRCVCPQPATV